MRVRSVELLVGSLKTFQLPVDAVPLGVRPGNKELHVIIDYLVNPALTDTVYQVAIVATGEDFDSEPFGEYIGSVTIPGGSTFHVFPYYVSQRRIPEYTIR